MEKYQQSKQTELLIDLHYLPTLDFIAGFLKFNQVWLEAHEHYQKQSYRNRCYIVTAHKVDALAVPVQQGTHHHPIRGVRIDNSQPWAIRHWRSLQAAYGKAPFFEYYAPDFEPVYQKEWEFLFDLNKELLTICLKLLNIRTPVNLTDCYAKSPEVGVFDARSALNSRNRQGLPLFYSPVPYQQNFGPDFVPNMSVIDLLFCQGPAALDVLTAGLRE
ncbi:WbqC family protein [Spirosoma sp. KUDC1026]|uniref:WbqC family protein n=1 Tax=Spirosoma sp. KUDC1026 TaxID=2745947 RepID=UPI00159B8868|nr:WbqC family protein [Spirosoma sp. KUDC1026]QKZ13092.1 WbqC family protein [Spirosoma sp. KUDC1026]